MVRRLALLVTAGALVIACGTSDGIDPEHVRRTSEALAAQCKASVAGHGSLDVETVYLPDVVHCENGGAPLESLKAQAIAARTYLYYKLETSGSIGDGQGDQVYTCGSHAGALEKQAVAETAGQILQYGGATIAAFYVAGGTSSPPACHDGASSTSADVTYNQGKSGNAITQTPLGFVSPSNTRNRGCMSQLGSRCLANAGKKDDAILKFYYGDDITITTALGPCVPTTPKAGVDGGADADPSGNVDGGSVSGDDDPLPPAQTYGAAASSDPPADAGGCAFSRARSPSSSTFIGAAITVMLLIRRRKALSFEGARRRAPSSSPVLDGASLRQKPFSKT